MDEALISSGVEKIRRVQSGWIPDLKSLRQNIDRLESLASDGQFRAVVELLGKLVPTFRSLVDAAGQSDRQRARRERVPKLRIADQSA